MDLTKALERNAHALAAIILALGAMLRAGISDTGRITKILRRAVLRILTPAESAVRRLIVIAARDLKGPGFVTSWDRGRPWPGREKPERGITRLTFPLFDPEKRSLLQPKPAALKPVHRIRSIDDVLRNPRLAVLAKELQEPPPPPDPTIDARRLYWRLDAARGALADIPGQARRLARLRRLRRASKKRMALSPLRPGHAPGHRKRQTHPVDDILLECQALAKAALADTS